MTAHNSRNDRPKNRGRCHSRHQAPVSYPNNFIISFLLNLSGCILSIIIERIDDESDKQQEITQEDSFELNLGIFKYTYKKTAKRRD